MNFPQDLQLPKTHTRHATAIRGLGCDAGACSDQQAQTGQRLIGLTQISGIYLKVCVNLTGWLTGLCACVRACLHTLSS